MCALVYRLRVREDWSAMHQTSLVQVNTSNIQQFWDVVYPTDHHTTPTRSQTIMLVNKQLSKNNWHIVPIKSPNVMAVELMGNFGKVHIYNIYNPCDSNNTIQFLERHMRSENNAHRNCQVAQGNEPEQREHIVWMGNFNRHHPMWELHSNVHLLTTANLDAVGELINLLSLYNLVQVLPLNIATLEASNTKNLTCPDNVFCTADPEQSFTQCCIVQDLRPVVMDHFPIISTVISHTFALLIRSSGCQIRSDPIHRSVPDPSR